MLVFIFIFITWIACDLAWWRWADMHLRRVRSRWRWAWRGLLAGFMVGQLGFVLVFFVGALAWRAPDLFPMVWAVAVYVWHFLVLPVVMLLLLSAVALRWLRSRAWMKRRPTEHAAAPTPIVAAGGGAAAMEADLPAIAPRMTRRQVLVALAVALPPLATAAVVGRALVELGGFRVRRVEVRLPQLPVDLDGLTIAHLSDLHIGKFLPAGMLERVAKATNDLEADLVVFTGDLIDVGKMESLPAGLAFLRSLDPRHGMARIEGNHDLMIEAEQFERALSAAGQPLLLDQAVTFGIPGRKTPVQFLGTSWGEWRPGSEMGRTGKDAQKLYRVASDEARAASVRQLAARREKDAFSILLAHHPHAFDPAAEAGIPLTLAGHTHGGQLMLTDRIGVGPMRFRYWTGLYRRDASALFVSNGIGNWFPMRVNAPPEVTHLTLRCG